MHINYVFVSDLKFDIFLLEGCGEGEGEDEGVFIYTLGPIYEQNMN